jgi:hypothetical protein
MMRAAAAWQSFSTDTAKSTVHENCTFTGCNRPLILMQNKHHENKITI